MTKTEPAMSEDKYKESIIGSKAEIQRESEFDAIYTGAWREATNAMKNAGSQRSGDSTGGSIDVSV